MRHHIRIRRFLNRVDHEAGAYVIATAPDSSTCPKSCEHNPWDPCRTFEVTISDCYRRITLDSSIDTAGERRNSHHKIEALIDSLEQFRDALAVESNRADAKRPRKVP